MELEQSRKVQAERLVELENQFLSMKNDNDLLEQQVVELTKWIQQLQEEKKHFVRQNLELENIRKWQ